MPTSSFDSEHSISAETLFEKWGNTVRDNRNLQKLLDTVEFCIINNGCEGKLTDDDYCIFCFMRLYCEQKNNPRN